EGGNELTDFVVPIHDGAQRRVDDEHAQHQQRQKGIDPPEVPAIRGSPPRLDVRSVAHISSGNAKILSNPESGRRTPDMSGERRPCRRSVAWTDVGSSG